MSMFMPARRIASLFAILSLSLAIGCSGGGSSGGAAAPPPGQPNSLPIAQVITTSVVQVGDVAFDLVLTDADGDNVSLTIEFTLDGTTFLTATLVGTPSLNGLVADDDGETYSFVWDSVADGVALAAIATGVQLRVVPSDDEGTGAAALSVAFEVDNVVVVPTTPLVSTVAPTGGPAGTIITIDGFNLGDDPSTVTASVGGVALAVVSLVTDLTTSTPDGFPSVLELRTSPEVDTGELVLDLNGVVIATGVNFTVAGRIASVSPGGVPEDGTAHDITLRGFELDRGTVEVIFTTGGGETVVAPTSVSNEEVIVTFPTALVPAAGGSLVDVQVAHDGGRSNAVQIVHADSALPQPPMPPVVGSVTVGSVEPDRRVAAGVLPIQFTLFDFGLDPADVLVEYSLEGGPRVACTEASTDALVPPLAVSSLALGFPHTFLWDAGADLGSGLRSSVRVHVTAVVPSGPTGGRFDSSTFWTSGEGSVVVTETFDDNAQHDAAASTADWNDTLGSTFGMTGALIGIADPFTEAPWGDGSDGPFAPTFNVTLTTDGVDPVFGGVDGVYRFTSLDVPPGVVVTASGANPLDLRVAGPTSILGTIDVSGADGTSANFFAAGSGGAAGVAGTPGGDGGRMQAGVPVNGSSGERGGRGGSTSLGLQAGATGGGGGGGGLASAGADGETTTVMGSGRGGVGGISRGFAAHPFLTGGAGGGGGGGVTDAVGGTLGSGGGGGGGGGVLKITGQNDVVISGTLRADGGAGGDGFDSGSGGGGSGGSIAICTPADIVFQDGVELSARGGAGGTVAPLGGAGSDGRVILAAPGPIELPTPGLPTLNLSGVQPGLGETGFSTGGFSPASFDPGAGTLGAFAPTSDVTLGTLVIDPLGGINGVYQFSSIDIPAGVTVTGAGPNPLVLLSTGDVNIDGTIVVSGDHAPRVPFLPLGSGGPGGGAGPGGGDGGDGGFYTGSPPTGVGTPGQDGEAPPIATGAAGGGGAQTVIIDDNDSTGGGGGGGGNAAAGAPGDDGLDVSGTPGGIAGPALGTSDFRDPADPDLIVLTGGTGGGGGGGNADGQLGAGTGGGGGGGGGGVLHIVSATTLTLGASASLEANGGDGSACLVEPGGKGGGGAGGGVLLQAETLDIDGAGITALGGVSADGMGTEGGAGSVGRIRLEQASSGGPGISGTVEPAPTLEPFDPNLRPSVARSTPIRAINADGFPIPAIRPGATTLTPDAQPAPATAAILWGVWKESPTGPVEFSGFTDDPSTLPRGEFIQFEVQMLSRIISALPAALDAVETTVDH